MSGLFRTTLALPPRAAAHRAARLDRPGAIVEAAVPLPNAVLDPPADTASLRSVSDSMLMLRGVRDWLVASTVASTVASAIQASLAGGTLRFALIG